MSGRSAERESCEACSGKGWRIVETAQGSYARRCECFRGSDQRRRLDRAGIPLGLRHCTLDSFEVHATKLELAKRLAHELVENFPLARKGLLFHGPVGTGKTHLAVAIVRELVTTRGANAIFLDFRKLLKTIQESWNADTRASEKQVLDRILSSDLLVLDDLGAEKSSEWVCETISYLINERYVNARPMVITTNLPLRVGSKAGEPAAHALFRERRGERSFESLLDRIGTPSLSRIGEMCNIVELAGVADFRPNKRHDP